ncbi:precorrin-8X methylmutase [Chloroflexia bacterium SDU3-3]|nr:precorrin-8X methylmutase [Chloroflexia bacterium SDU3-3]
MTDFEANPAAIAADSFTTIRAELRALGIALEPPLDALIERAIHSTADMDFARITRASQGAVAAGAAALRRGCPVLADVHMVRVGISERRLAALGGSLHCLVADPETRARAEAAGVTRSAMAMRIAHERGLLDGAVVAVGNAPTALYEIIRLVDAGAAPALVLGVPVGFINTAESKAALAARPDIPWVITEGRKGGSTVAVAMVNALLRLAAGADAADID